MPATWIEAARPPKIPLTNAHASACTPVVFLLVHISWFTFVMVILTVIAVAILSIKGRTVSWLVRKSKCNLRGRKLHARPVWYRRRMLRVTSHGSLGVSFLRQGL